MTIDELCGRIKFQRQTIYNLIHRKMFLPGKHFLKPSPKKILFRWSAIQAWIGESTQPEVPAPEPPEPDPTARKREKVSLIRI